MTNTLTAAQINTIKSMRGHLVTWCYLEHAVLMNNTEDIIRYGKELSQSADIIRIYLRGISQELSERIPPGDWNK